jgi:hypothetical protein
MFSEVRRILLMKKLLIFLISFLAVVTMSCSTIYDVRYDYERKTNFAGLKTYDWLVAPEGAEIEPLLQDRLKNAVNTALEGKGLRMTSDDPDFLIAMQTMSKEKVRHSPKAWGYGYGSRWYSHKYRTRTYDEGTLVLDFVDNASKKLIWRGTAQGLVESNMTPEKLDDVVSEAVQKTLKNFPPPTSK